MASQKSISRRDEEKRKVCIKTQYYFSGNTLLVDFGKR